MSWIVFSRLNVALLAAMACVTLAGFLLLRPDHGLPLHWNWHGGVDRWGQGEGVLLLLPIAAGAMTLFFWLLDRAILKLDELHGGRQYALGLSSALAVFVVLQVMIIAYGMGYPVKVSRATAFVTAFFFIVIGNILPKVQPGAPRLDRPKSLDVSQQRRVHRLTGAVMMVSGFGLLIAAALDVPAAWLNSGTMAAAFVPAAVGIAYTLLLQSQRPRSG